MSDITIKKISGPRFIRKLDANGEPTTCGLTEQTANACNSREIPDCVTITIRNFESLEFRLESPAGDFPIPETEDFGNIVVKAEGNRLSINVSWTLHEENCSVVSGYCGAPTITTVQQQIDYWINTFQPYSIESKYLLKADGITRIGFIRSLSFTKSASTPVTYSANLDFIAGDVVAGE